MTAYITEVGPRDGLQNEKIPVPTEVKARFIANLTAAGLKQIEATSFVSPKWVPQLGDAADLWKMVPKSSQLSALVPNAVGLERALTCGAKRIAVFTAASDAFVRKNINMTIEESLAVFSEVITTFKAAQPKGHVRGYVSTVFECPYAGRIEPAAVIGVCKRLFELGANEVSLGDTIGTGSVSEVKTLAKALSSEFDKGTVVWHFHDTFGGAVANVGAALDAGYRKFDSSAAGLGGCPYAPGAAGNLATEDLVYFMHRNGVKTGVDLDWLAKASLEVLEVLGRSPSAKAQVATLSRAASF